MAQAIMADSFEPSKRGLAFALYGLVAVLAPSIGPTLGGWITDNYSWHWIFYINIPVGILALFLTNRLVEDPPYQKADRNNFYRIDYIGVESADRSLWRRCRSRWIRARKRTGLGRTSSSFRHHVHHCLYRLDHLGVSCGEAAD